MRHGPVIKRALILASTMLIGAASGCSSRLPDTLPVQQTADRIVIAKSSHTMTLMSDGHVLKVYRVALGRGSTGPKERQGDHKTPEGQYVVDRKNARSRFHLALHLSYPNQEDAERARRAGVDPGGLIEIHGLPTQFAWLGSLQHDIDWTDGCVAVTNREIEEIWRLVPVGTPIEIKP